jgi:hypothetical protein
MTSLKQGEPVTESEWLSCEDPTAMLEFLRASGRASERRLRLFVCASTRLLWEHLQPGLMQEAVEAAERLADGAPWEECQRLLMGLHLLPAEHQRLTAERWSSSRAGEAWAALFCALRAVSHSFWLSEMPRREGWSEHSAVTARRQPALLRDIYGNPFGPPPALEPSLLKWNDGLVVKLALAAYDERALPSGVLDPDRLSVLADSLEEAGCGDAALLGHLRSPGPHYRGCHGIDAVLGRG